ncbi:PglL family O-oligosaccharyltransferase [Pararobbsia silviterrae]|uniref:Polymerase n=1 Tax=Pararobbsia silviterrae TaxID=1792498 RepID=A0A494YA12_9BURK|nr:O-antigen ligase family protein [Pararobbsia silviterrae]RKP58985.1 polymerase [Pararobbsia silviterrae]
MPVQLPRILTLFLLMLALTIPYGVVTHTYPIPTFYAEFVAYTLFLLMSLGVAWYASTTRSANLLASPRSGVIMLLFGIWLVLQTVIVPTTLPRMNLLGFGYVMLALLVMHAGFWCSRMLMAPSVVRAAAIALVIGALFAVFCQVVQTFGWELAMRPFVVAYRVADERRPFGNMAQANHLATYIAFGLTAATYLVLTRRLPWIVWVVVSALFAIGQALTVSRTPWLQTGVIVLGALALGLNRQPEANGEAIPTRRPAPDGGAKRWRAWIAPIGLFAIFVVANVFVRWANTAWHLRLATSAAERFQEAGQISPRLALWKYGWSMFRESPLFGVGWGEFPIHQYGLTEALGKIELANNSHDIVIDLLGKTGIIGTVIVFGGLAMWLIRVLRARHNPGMIFGLTILAVLGVHALVEYPQQYMFFLLPAAFIVGLLEPAGARFVPVPVTRVAYGLLLVAGLGALYPVLADYGRAEVLYYGESPEKQYRAAPAEIFKPWGDYGLATLLTLDAKDLSSKIDMHRKAMYLLPGDVVLRRQAALLVLAGREDEALDTVRRMKVYADGVEQWPSSLSGLYEECDQMGPPLAHFKAKVLAEYGQLPEQPKSSDDDDDDSDD